MKKEEPDYNTNLNASLLLLLVMAALLFAFAFLAPFIFTKPANSASLDFSKTGSIGDTIGGLMSPFINLSAVIVTGLAFYMQYRANKLQVTMFKDQLLTTTAQFKTEQQTQLDQAKLSQFESQFFEMLRLHKANVDEMTISGLRDQVIVSRRQVFEKMTEEFDTLLGYAVFGNMPLTQLEFDTAYNIYFWGYDLNELRKLSQPARDWISRPTVQGNTGITDFTQHSGYSYLLGHYFRHLYMMVKFVAFSDIVTCYEEKMKYLKILRAQLSNYEQIMLFYNWVATDYGGDWENEQNHFFTQFKMIHNLWYTELYQNQFIVDKVNMLIDKYNLNKKETPLFEFEGIDFNKKMPDIQTNNLGTIFN